MFIHALPKFSKYFKECDASNVGIEAIMIQEGHAIAQFDEKLNGNYIYYTDMKMYVLVRFL